MARIQHSIAAFTPEDASRDSPKGTQATPVFLGRRTQKASDAYAMRYADVKCLAVRSSLGEEN
jgi:hypothetical protein